ncbi:reticulon-like protein B14 isoform X2 [Carica papaya]|uniref:reticulon-like protein B14 isoform X2 n=1 Tax=Carica papaya TaxID=3649 RepID=UPI000B8CAD3F|nr:reticulon-like protein B14 isoform X2 [Carica papaya]
MNFLEVDMVRTLADICLWRNQNISLSMLIGSTVIWFLLEVVECYFIPLVCYVLILMMIMLFLWSNGAGIFNSMKGPPGFDEIKLSESTCEYVFSKINWVMAKLYHNACSNDLKPLLLTTASLWIFSYEQLFQLLDLHIYCISLLWDTTDSLYAVQRSSKLFSQQKQRRDRELFSDGQI